MLYPAELRGPPISFRAAFVPSDTIRINTPDLWPLAFGLERGLPARFWLGARAASPLLAWSAGCTGFARCDRSMFGLRLLLIVPDVAGYGSRSQRS